MLRDKLMENFGNERMDPKAKKRTNPIYFSLRVLSKDAAGKVSNTQEVLSDADQQSSSLCYKVVASGMQAVPL